MIGARTTRARTAAVAALALGLTLTGCASIPESGAVSSHTLRQDAGDSTVNFLLSKPVAGSSQEDIVTGFIRAGLGPQNDYRVAREFLAPDFASKWNPDGGVSITDGSSNTITRTGDNSVEVTVHTTATVDARGEYTPSVATTDTEVPIDLEKVHGQWRISSAPDGTVLTPSNFSQVFDPYPLYFFDQSGQYLVPDLRWFANVSGVAERVARALVQGPSPWLGTGAVVTAFPSGTQLGSDGVSVSHGVATVDLSTNVLSESTATKQRISQQVSSTLDGLGTVRTVDLTSEGVALSDATGGTPPTVDPDVPDQEIAYHSGAFGAETSSGIHSLSGLGAKVASLTPLAATIDDNQATVAVLAAAGVYRVSTTGDPVLIDRRAGLIAPAVDPHGMIWSAQSASISSAAPATLQAIDPKGVVHPVALSASLPAGASLTAMRISRDGARIALGVTTSSGPEVLVAGIIRDSTQTPTQLGPYLDLPLPAGDGLIDLAWSDQVTVAVLLSEGSSVAVRSIQVGGRSTALGRPPSGMRQIVGGNSGVEGLRLVGNDGVVRDQNASGGWQSTGSVVSFLAVQQ